jgi:hypothetical protein
VKNAGCEADPYVRGIIMPASRVVDKPDVETKQGVRVHIFWDVTKRQDAITRRDSVSPQNTRILKCTSVRFSNLA